MPVPAAGATFIVARDNARRGLPPLASRIGRPRPLRQPSMARTNARSAQRRHQTATPKTAQGRARAAFPRAKVRQRCRLFAAPPECHRKPEDEIPSLPAIWPNSLARRRALVPLPVAEDGRRRNRRCNHDIDVALSEPYASGEQLAPFVADFR